MKVVVLPGPILCADCGDIVAAGSKPNPPHFLCPISCQNLKCVSFNKVAFFPLAGLDLPNIEPQGPQIIMPQ